MHIPMTGPVGQPYVSNQKCKHDDKKLRKTLRFQEKPTESYEIDGNHYVCHSEPLDSFAFPFPSYAG